MRHSRSSLLVTVFAVAASSPLGCAGSNGGEGSGGAGAVAAGVGGSTGGTASGGSGNGGATANGGRGGAGTAGAMTGVAGTIGSGGSGGATPNGGSGGSGAGAGTTGTGGAGGHGGSAGASGGAGTGGTTGTGGNAGTTGAAGAGGSAAGGRGGATAGSGGSGATGGNGASGGAGGSTSTDSYKPRVINTTDLGADPDDEMSLVRVMATSNEFDIEGLIVVTSLWKTSQSSTSTLDKIVNAYGQVVSNLQKHASGYPSLAYLQSISKLGQTGFGMAAVGSGKDSPGSELIIAAVDKPDPRPVWINLWGGGNTLGQALWKVKNTRTQAQVDQFVSKLRVYDVLGQDDAGAWMTKTFPSLFYIRFKGVYSWQPSDNWVASNVQNKGPLGAVYPKKAYAIEGDTPSFLYQYPNGLSDPEHPDWGSWGGRMDTTKKSGSRGMTGGASYNEAQYDPYYMIGDASEGGASVGRWSTALNSDFAARMIWSVTSAYSGANHHPIAVVNKDTTR